MFNERQPATLLKTTTERNPAQHSSPLFPLKTRRNRLMFDRTAMGQLPLADQILTELFGQGPLVAPAFDCLHHAFEAHAAAQPGAVAVRHGDASITYGELERQANRLAARLSAAGVRPGDHVALFLQRSLPMIVGILGILKAGAAYVPQHIGVAPEGQLRHILHVAATRIILTTTELEELVPVPEGHVCLAIDRLMQEPFADANEFCAPFESATPVEPDHNCYILFTSGTTGSPNGVQVTHRNVCNILLTRPGNLGIRPGMKVAQILSIAFDMAAWEILGCLGNGATLIIRGHDIEAAVRQADVVIATPSVLASLDASRCRNVRVVAVAGEPCPRPLADTWAAFATFYNSCGPTETTIVNTMQRYSASSTLLTIGRPTPNNTVYVLNEELQPCAIGEVGEMWAGGDCVSAGYLHNDQLNRERYAPDPFLGNGRVMFRTRDLGRWTADGELEHFGRTDDQVKVRGFRVELDSVSAALETVEGCRQAVALKFDSRSLVAFVTPATIDEATAQEAVAAALPYYCVPALVVALDSLPITSRGKVDKRALLALATEQLSLVNAAEPAEQLAAPQPVKAKKRRKAKAVAATPILQAVEVGAC